MSEIFWKVSTVGLASLFWEVGMIELRELGGGTSDTRPFSPTLVNPIAIYPR